MSHSLLSLTLRATPVLMGFVMFNAIIIGWHFDQIGTAVLAVFMLLPALLICLPAPREALMRKSVPLWGLGTLRVLYAFILAMTLLAMRFAVPGTFSPFLTPLFAASFFLCFLYPGWVFDEVRHLAPPPRPRLRDLPFEPIDRKAYPWVRPVACALLGFVVLGSCGLAFSRLIPAPVWANIAIALSVLVATQGMVLFFWAVCKQRNLSLNDISLFFPRIAVFCVIGFTMLCIGSYGALAKALPEFWHLVANAPQAHANHVIHETDLKSGRRFCSREMTVYLTEKQLATTTLCGLPQSSFEDTKQGDLLVVVGRTSWFGQSVASTSVIRR